MINLEKINNSLLEMEQELEKIKTVKELITTVQSTASLTVEEAHKATQNLKTTSEKLISETKKTADETINETKRLQKNTRELANLVNELMKKLDKIDFPTRLDKIDNSINTINSTIQNLFNRFDTIERNLKDDINTKINMLNENLKKSKNINYVLLTTNLFFIFISLFLLFYIINSIK